MSLASRLLGVALCLSGGWLMGSAQGVITISNAANNIIVSQSIANAAVGAYTGLLIGGLVEAQLTADYGSYWAFGIILASLGLAIIWRGDRKPRPPEEAKPLLTEPL